MSSFFASFRTPVDANSVNSSAVESESDGSDFVQECVNGISVPTQTLPPPPSVELPELPELPPMPEMPDTSSMKIAELEEKLRETEEKNQQLEEKNQQLEEKNQQLKKKNRTRKRDLKTMYIQERDDQNTITALKKRVTELHNDRNMFRCIIDTQQAQLDAWMECYKKSWEDYDYYQAEEEDEEWNPKQEDYESSEESESEKSESEKSESEESESESEEEVEEEESEESKYERWDRNAKALLYGYKYEEDKDWKFEGWKTEEEECELEYENERGGESALSRTT